MKVVRAKVNTSRPCLASEFGGIYPEMVMILEKYLVPHCCILEPGCGGGRATLELKVKHPDLSVILLDINRHTLSSAKSLFDEVGVPAEFVLGDILHLPFKNDSFDLCFNEGVVEHMDTATAINNMARVAKTVAVFIPNGIHPYYLIRKLWKRFRGTWVWDKKYGFERSISPWKTRKYFREAGLTIVETHLFRCNLGAEYGIVGAHSQ